MIIFNFDGLSKKQNDLITKNILFYYKVISLLFIIFFIKFIYRYNYQKYTLFFICLYSIFLASYPISKKLTKNTFIPAWVFFNIVISIINILIFMSGGFKAPGIIWLTLFPFFGISVLGRRGFFWGIFQVSLWIFIFIIFKSLGIEMYPFANFNEYYREFQINLIIFSFTSFYYIHNYTKAEYIYQKKLEVEKIKNDNLIRILFHDLSNPMQTMRMLIKKLQNNREPEKLQKTISQIDRTSIRIVEILEHVRQMKALEDKKIKFDIKEVSIAEVVNNLKDLYEEKINEKNIELFICSNQDIKIHADPVYFTYQVMANLLSNAIKFTEKDGKILIIWEDGPDASIIKIIDTGIGIPEDIIQNIFNEDGQNSRRGTFGELGTGYGMPLVKTFVNEFKGEIKIDSKEKSVDPLNHGTTISLIFKK